MAALLLLSAPASAEARAKCGPRDAAGGEWRSYGHDLRNTRHQPREQTIGPAEARRLEPAWSFSTVEAGGIGDVTGTPVVADGCVYFATSLGWVFALNADTGKLVWKREVPEDGNVFGTVRVTRKRVYVGVARVPASLSGCRGDDRCPGPYVAAFKRRSGRLDWVSRTLDRQPGAEVWASPVVFKGTLLLGVSGAAAELGEKSYRRSFQGSMSFLNARTGKRLRKTWTIHPPHRPKDDFAGAGIWSTPAIDRRAKVAYAGTANPYVPKAQHPRANAVLKFDVDRRSRTFGKILGHYEGTPEEYLEAFSDAPCIDLPGNVPAYPTGLGSCGDLDLDFGASPNLFKVDGRKLVGAGQKSGVYHVFDAKTMKPVWERVLGAPGYFGGILGSTAYDGRSIYGPITIPGYAWSLSAADGSYRWVAPIADGLHWGPPVAVANGVVYTVDFTGFLDAFDARSGLPLLKRPLLMGTEHDRLTRSWGGISVARNTVYAAVGVVGSDGFIVAFRPR